MNAIVMAALTNPRGDLRPSSCVKDFSSVVLLNITKCHFVGPSRRLWRSLSEHCVFYCGLCDHTSCGTQSIVFSQKDDAWSGLHCSKG